MKRRDLFYGTCVSMAAGSCVKVENIRFGRTRQRTAAPRCRVIGKSPVTLQGESASSLAFPCRLEFSRDR